MFIEYLFKAIFLVYTMQKEKAQKIASTFCAIQKLWLIQEIVFLTNILCKGTI